MGLLVKFIYSPMWHFYLKEMTDSHTVVVLEIQILIKSDAFVIQIIVLSFRSLDRQ